MGGEGVVVASMWSFNRCRPSSDPILEKCLNKNDILFHIEQKYCVIIFINIIIICEVPIIIILYGAGGISSSLWDTGMGKENGVAENLVYRMSFALPLFTPLIQYLCFSIMQNCNFIDITQRGKLMLTYTKITIKYANYIFP